MKGHFLINERINERMNECVHVYVCVCIYGCIFIGGYIVYVRMYKLRIGAKCDNHKMEAKPSRYCSVYFLDRSAAVTWLRHESSVWWHLARKVFTELPVESMLSRTPCYSMLWVELNCEIQKELEIRTQMNQISPLRTQCSPQKSKILILIKIQTIMCS